MDLYRFGDDADFHGEVDAGDGADLQEHVGSRGRFETLSLGADRVVSWSQKGNVVGAGRIRVNFTDLTGGRVADAHQCPVDAGAGGVGHSACDLSKFAPRAGSHRRKQ